MSTWPLIVGIAGQSLVFRDQFTAGSRGSGIVIQDEHATGEHAVFRPGSNGWTVEDLGSTNGTWLNGARIWGPRVLCKGDQVRIGHTVLTVIPAG